jgi:DNA-binding CsgD family transcriptional regulator
MVRTHIRHQDLRALVDLLRDLDDLSHDLSHNPQAVFRHMFDGLLRVIGADGGPMAPIGDFHPGGLSIYRGLEVRGFTSEAERRIIEEGLGRSMTSTLVGTALVHAYVPGRVLTRLRSELVREAQWSASPYGSELRRIAGVRDGLYCAAPTNGTQDAFGFGLYRSGAGSRFGDVERDLLHLFQQGMLPIYRKMLRRPAPAALAELAARLRPSHRATLRAVLRGLSEKEIAQHLGLSRNTVHEYVGALYGHFGVSSRSELLSLFIPSELVPK